MALVNQSFTFGNVVSSDFNIYVGGEGTYNAPVRETKVITIPGRNGAFAMDLGRFENITLTYPCFYKADDLSTFSADLADFRAAMCSQIGYQRLEDTLNPYEYREALFIGGLEVRPVKYNTVANFDIVFNCKPQRWWKSGEIATVVTSGGTLTNPTPFASKPIIEAKGYGSIDLAGQAIEIANNPLGDIVAWNAQTLDLNESTTGQLEAFNSATEWGNQVNTGDTITLAPTSVVYTFTASAVGVSQETGTGTVTATVNGTSAVVAVEMPALTFTAGTAATFSKIFMLEITTTTAQTVTRPIDVSIAYDGNRTWTFSRTWWVPDMGTHLEAAKPPFTVGQLVVSSTVTPDVTIIIDCAIGVAYYSDGTDANSNVSLPSNLPELAPGANVITYDNTFTTFNVTPRWWAV